MDRDYEKFLNHIGVTKTASPQKNSAEKSDPLSFKSELEKYITPSALNKEFVEKGKRECEKPLSLSSKNIKPDETLDLHGVTLDAAVSMLQYQLRRCSLGRVNFFLVITGKGLHSEGEPVLKYEISHQLKTSPYVAEVKQAPPSLGGGGAFLARIKHNVEE